MAWKPQPVQPVKAAPIKREVVKAAPKPTPTPVVELPKPKIYAPVATAPVVRTARKNVPAPDMTEVAKAFPDPTPADFDGQLGDSDVEEASRGSADGRVRRPQRTAGQLQQQATQPT